MTGEAGAPGTAGDRYKVEPPTGRHRAPPPPPRPDRFTVPIAAAAAILTCAGLLAIAGQAVAPDATAAASTTTAPTAARVAHTVHVPLTILPAPVPTIGGPGIWDPETDAQIPVSAPLPTQSPRSIPVHRPVATEAAQVTTEAGIDTTTQTDAATTPETTTATPSPTSTAAATTTESSATTTEEQPVITTPTATATQTTDIGDVIDQALEDALGETP